MTLASRSIASAPAQRSSRSLTIVAVLAPLGRSSRSRARSRLAWLYWDSAWATRALISPALMVTRGSPRFTRWPSVKGMVSIDPMTLAANWARSAAWTVPVISFRTGTVSRWTATTCALIGGRDGPAPELGAWRPHPARNAKVNTAEKRRSDFMGVKLGLRQGGESQGPAQIDDRHAFVGVGDSAAETGLNKPAFGANEVGG